ncbi:hypothetical protein [Streptomyces albus]|uniref:hypothetical protein n=1 Tax=Streptomyces albus TaxID=1888 RepID=UPI003F1B62CD
MAPAATKPPTPHLELIGPLCSTPRAPPPSGDGALGRLGGTRWGRAPYEALYEAPYEASYEAPHEAPYEAPHPSAAEA